MHLISREGDAVAGFATHGSSRFSTEGAESHHRAGTRPSRRPAAPRGRGIGDSAPEAAVADAPARARGPRGAGARRCRCRTRQRGAQRDVRSRLRSRQGMNNSASPGSAPPVARARSHRGLGPRADRDRLDGEAQGSEPRRDNAREAFSADGPIERQASSAGSSRESAKNGTSPQSLLPTGRTGDRRHAIGEHAAGITTKLVDEKAADQRPRHAHRSRRWCRPNSQSRHHGSLRRSAAGTSAARANPSMRVVRAKIHLEALPAPDQMMSA